MNCEANKKESSKLLNGPSNDNQSTSSVSQISSSLMSISSKKHKNSSLSLNKRSPANPAHFLNTIKNSTLNVLSKPLNLSRSPSPQMNTRKQFKPIDLEANIIVNNKLDLIESSDDEEMDQYDENLGNEGLSTIDELDLNQNKVAEKDFVCKAVEESDSDSDSSTSNQDSVEQSKLNMCSCSKPSLKTLSYSNPNTSSSQMHIGKPSNNKFKCNELIFRLGQEKIYFSVSFKKPQQKLKSLKLVRTDIFMRLYNFLLKKTKIKTIIKNCFFFSNLNPYKEKNFKIIEKLFILIIELNTRIKFSETSKILKKNLATLIIITSPNLALDCQINFF
ncbi:hypothetical protein BpHYR1_009874 [Brachionus plicatilis]|uniref:Uncharacterized protein n=1 Tax=Brachionus plicatilis TaxID=10195 RepID=A0A3M7RJ72_BRAPC|nr:hypothetical protein BpHYR1_009874 [Brachionus plicatilis]